MSDQFDGIFSELAKAGYFRTIDDLQIQLDNKINTAEKGSPDGVATLDTSGKVPSVQLPSYVDDVLEYPNYNSLPVLGESSKIYITNDTNKTYRWSGSGYVEITASPGTTDSVVEGSVNLYFTADRARAAVTDIPGNAATASKLQTPRTISLSGDVTGSVLFDGGSSVTILSIVADDSHRHSATTIDGLGTVVSYNVPSSGNNATSNQVVLGNDTRLSDPRPASDVSAWAKSPVKPTYSYSEVGAQPLDSDLTAIAGLSGSGLLNRDTSGAWSLSPDVLSSAYNAIPMFYTGSNAETSINCDDLPYGVAAVSLSSANNTKKPVFDNCTYAYIQTIKGIETDSLDGKIQIAWPMNNLDGGNTIIAFRSYAGTGFGFPIGGNGGWKYITPSDYALTTHTHSITALGGQPLDSDLTAISKLTSADTGIMCRTGTGAYATRTITSSKTSAITISNGDGRTTDPTINLVGDLNAIDNLPSSPGFLKKVSDSNWTLDNTSYSPVGHTHGAATATSDGFMTTTQVAALTSVTTDIASLQTGKEPTITTLPVSKGGTGVNTLTGIGYFNGTEPISAATSAQIRSLFGTSTTLMTGLNADLLDGLHASSFSPVGHSHSVATTTSDGFMSSAHVSALSSVTSDISSLQSSKEDKITTLPVSKGGTGVNTLTGIGYFNGTSSITPATSTQIRSLIGTSTTLMTGLNADLLDGLHSSDFSPVGHVHGAATASSDGFMTSAHVSTLTSATTNIANLQTGKENKISLSGILKGNGTSGLSTATSADIRPLVAGTTDVLTNLNADLLDGLHATQFSLVGETAAKRQARCATSSMLIAANPSTTNGGTLTRIGTYQLPSATIASGVTSFNSISVASSRQYRIKIGAVVSGGTTSVGTLTIPANTTVISTSSTTVTFSNNLTLSSNTSGVTITNLNFENGFEVLTVDGMTGSTNKSATSLMVGDLVLVKDDYPQWGGLYEVQDIGSTTTPWVLVRTPDANTERSLCGSIITVDAGTTNANTIWMCYNNIGTFTLHTSSVTWMQVFGDGLVDFCKVSTNTTSTNKFLSQVSSGTPLWTALDKTSVGLSNVDNTSDTDKPVSSAVQTALNGKLNTTGGVFSGALWSANGSALSPQYSFNNEQGSGFYRHSSLNVGLTIGGALTHRFNNTSILPGADNSVAIGSSSFRYSTIYAATGTINTSDARMKTPIRQFSDAEIRASSRLCKEFGVYKFIDALEAKGNNARLHIGMTVQRAIEILTEEGLNPFDYGFICYDQWESEYDSDGNEEIKAGDRYGFRYIELINFILRGQEERLRILEENMKK